MDVESHVRPGCTGPGKQSGHHRTRSASDVQQSVAGPDERELVDQAEHVPRRRLVARERPGVSAKPERRAIPPSGERSKEEVGGLGEKE
jgi:hypothetical protein